MLNKQLYVVLAETIDSYHRCKTHKNEEWLSIHEERLENLATNHLPSGSGIDSGTTIDITRSNRKIVLDTGFHHMNEAGFYDGWTHHTIIVRPEFGSFRLSISGRDRNQIKKYLHNVFYHALCKEIEI